VLGAAEGSAVSGLLDVGAMVGDVDVGLLDVGAADGPVEGEVEGPLVAGCVVTGW
jgi:hypothetical protein